MDELAKRFAALAEQYGPRVANAAVEAARVEAYSSMVTNIFLILGGVVLVLVARHILKKDRTQSWDAELPMIGGAIMFGVGCVIFFIGVVSMADPWLWTTINNPELWLAKKAFKI